MNRDEFEKEQLGDRPTSAYEGRTQPATDSVPAPAPFDSPESHERNTADPAQQQAATESMREERRREGGGDAGQRDSDSRRDDAS